MVELAIASRLFVSTYSFYSKKIVYQAERPENFTVPICIIGNITVGGSGKTPLTITILNNLVSLGYKPGIVSRGYQAHAPRYPFSVKSDGDATVTGDEPLLIAKKTQCQL